MTEDSPEDGRGQAQEKKYYQIGSLEKGVRILETIVEHGELTVTKAAALLGINRASAHRFIITLRDMGYLQKNKHNNYEATFKLLEMGMRQADNFEIRRLAKPMMKDLAARFGETVNLGVLDRDLIVYLDKVESRELLRMDSGVGTTCPAYASALGKAILAFLPEDTLKSYYARVNMRPFTAKSIVEAGKLEEELASVRRSGYAIDNEELALGLYCMGAPIFDFSGYPAYALSVSGPAMRVKAEKEIPEQLLACAAELSRTLGYKGK